MSVDRLKDQDEGHANETSRMQNSRKLLRNCVVVCAECLTCLCLMYRRGCLVTLPCQLFTSALEVPCMPLTSLTSVSFSNDTAASAATAIVSGKVGRACFAAGESQVDSALRSGTRN